MEAKEPKCSYHFKLDTWEESRRFLKLTRIQEYQGGYGNIRDSYKDDWNNEDEDLLAEVLSDLNFFSAEKRTSASSKGEFSGGCNLNEDMENVKPGGAKITLIREDRTVSPTLLVHSASEYLFLPPQDTFQEYYAMTHVDDLPVQDERSEKTDRLDMSQTPRDNGEQVTVEASEPDVRRVEDTREEKTLRDVKDGVNLRDDTMDDRSVGEEKDMKEKDEGEQKDEREEKNMSKEKNVWEENEEKEEKEENEEMDEKEEKEEKEEMDEKEEKDLGKEKGKKDMRKECVRPEKSVRESEDKNKERKMKEIERGEDIGNGSETGVTRKAWKMPMTCTTWTGDVIKNMGTDNALLISTENMVNKPKKATSESSTALTMNTKKTRKDKKKKEAKQTIIQRIKSMKAPKIKIASKTVNPSKGEKFEQTCKEAYSKEPKIEENKMYGSPQIVDAARLDNIKPSVDKKLWNTINHELRKKARVLLDEIRRVASIVGQNAEIILANFNSYNVSFGI